MVPGLLYMIEKSSTRIGAGDPAPTILDHLV